MHFKKLKLIALLIVVILKSGFLYAQPDMLWSQTYGGEDGDVGYSVVQTEDGGFAIAGRTNSFGEGESNGWLVKTDEDGEEIWSHAYGGELGGGFSSLVQTDDGGFALAGYTFFEGEGDHTYHWVVRTDDEGEEIWSNTYGGVGGCESIIQTEDKEFAIVCYVVDLQDPASFTLLIKIDEVGEEVWSHSYYDEWGYNWCNSVVQTEDGGYALAGYIEPIESNADFWLVKTDVSGRKIWSRTINGRGREVCNSLILTSDGGFALAGTTNSRGEGETDFWIVVTDDNGDGIMGHSFGGERYDICYSVIQTEDDGYVLAGYTNSNEDREHDFWLVRTDDNCEEIWSQTYDGEQDETCFSVIQTEDGGFALTGIAISLDERVGSLWLVKTEPDPVSVPHIVDPSFPSAITLLPIFPNPFNSRTIIRFDLSSHSVLKITAYDLFGREIAILSERSYSSGQHSVVWNANNVPTGEYLLRLEAGENVQAGKIVLLK